ncbi:MAG: MBL fold metallo-hydrolase [Chloroflexi bacterium]|nr:MBL fold metallo-hydrolase [Chloroflexota bacterium]
MAIEITWLGRTCFRLKGREGVVVTDPCPPESGYRLGKMTADVVTLSNRDEPGYSDVDLVTGQKVVLDAPGEYEVGGVLVTGVATKRADGRRNVAFVYELDGIRVAHLGLPGPGAGVGMLDDIKGVDILLMPVGGGNSLNSANAADVMTTIDARVAIPMNYKTEFETAELETLERFLKESGAKPEPQPRFQVSKSQLPTELTVFILQPKP